MFERVTDCYGVAAEYILMRPTDSSYMPRPNPRTSQHIDYVSRLCSVNISLYNKNI